MDLSKALETINQDLLIAKFQAYDFDNSSLKFLISYLSNRWYATKINQNIS